MGVVYDCQIQVEEEEDEDDDEDNEDDEAEMPRMVLNRQIAKRCQFTLYEKWQLWGKFNGILKSVI